MDEFGGVLEMARQLDAMAVLWRRADTSVPRPAWLKFWVGDSYQPTGRPDWPQEYLGDVVPPRYPLWGGASWLWEPYEHIYIAARRGEVFRQPTEPAADPSGREGLIAGEVLAEKRPERAGWFLDLPRFQSSAFLQATDFLLEVKWPLVSVEAQGLAAVRRVSTITLLELDARDDDNQAPLAAQASTADRFRKAATQKRAVAGDVHMTLQRIPADWRGYVFEPPPDGPAPSPVVRGHW